MTKNKINSQSLKMLSNIQILFNLNQKYKILKGMMALSRLTSAPIYDFGTAERSKILKQNINA